MLTGSIKSILWNIFLQYLVKCDDKSDDFFYFFENNRIKS
ncbi:hypothetical protein ESCAB7627_0677 [Escherichia albertii TW07627]|uniref:Uncharacterized protein n=1 Tax=Escherichia albertii (strain TW07627) TaxID=502347 RepID=A0ABC9NUA6_ESCAT|nr:hypothetical protein ESCAB7627_0677 [Escherichia albertii TW07627]